MFKRVWDETHTEIVSIRLSSIVGLSYVLNKDDTRCTLTIDVAGSTGSTGSRFTIEDVETEALSVSVCQFELGSSSSFVGSSRSCRVDLQ